MRNSNKINLLLIEDEEFDVRRVENTIQIFHESLSIKQIVSNGADALKILEGDPNGFDVIIMDYQIAGAIRGEELIKKIKKINQTLQIIVITKLTINITDFDFAKKLVDAGAFWYCTKYPGDIEEFIYQPTDFLMSVFNAFEKKKLEMQTYSSKKKLAKNIEDILERKKIIGESESTIKLKSKIEKLAESDVSILITGASGTGKELVANNIHYKSKRKYENFVPINCGSIPHDLIESELFGYEKGAFTGAAISKAGLFEVADRGTIFLDEIAELPMNAQVKLLRVIQEGEIEKIGRTQKIKVDVRIIAATNKDLKLAVENGLFREDLYYRLNVVPLHITQLKDKPEDIPILVQHFLEIYSLEIGKPVIHIDPELVRRLQEYNWPGNVRELRNVIQRLIFNANEKITIDDYQYTLIDSGNSKSSQQKLFNFGILEEIPNLKTLEKDFKKEFVEFVRDNSDSDAEAAHKLGIAPSNFHRLCKDLGLK
ncbi:MAG: sigma-54 dependent transcriptional regulator [Melioribacteraceae bacterium]|jgi:DNA-binding NtrC family response regulator|nr:sigma-54 dependent transcriptional regulator [Melioribacteraceae bacterium]RJP56362.1 MAG: sigma-54-dependent Fis family transcriptional regulator [Ignavibacteriales bacterium]WKZ70835.1 MAG: sigma-54 dependent transcriptional regulator [Melioribacteraceae bacterium]